MSDSNVQVNIVANASAFISPVGDATVQAANFAKALELAGGDLRKITPEMLGMAAATKTAAAAVVEVQTAVKAATVDFKAIIDAQMMAGRGFKSAAESASVFEKALDPSPLQKMKSLLEETEPAAHKAHGGVAGITREFIVLGREAMVGNYSRIPGSMMALAERAGGVVSAIGNVVTSFTPFQIVGVASVLAVAAAMVVLIEKAHEANKAIREAMNSAAMQGRSPIEAAAEVNKYADALKETGFIGTAATHQIGSAITQLSEITAEQRGKINDMAPGFFLNFQKDAKKTTEEIDKIFASDTGLKSYLDQNHVLSIEATKAWDAATTAAQRYDIGIAALGARLDPMVAKAKAMQDAADMNKSMAMLGAEGGGNLPVQGEGNLTGPQDLGDFQPGTKAPDQGKASDAKVVEEHTAQQRQLLKLTTDLAAEQRALADATTANDQASVTSATEAIRATQDLITNFHLAGDASWEQKQAAALEQVKLKVAATATSQKQLNMETAQAVVGFWTEAAKQQDMSDQQRMKVTASLTAARLAMARVELGEVATWQQTQTAALEDIKLKIAAHATSTKQLNADTAAATVRFWQGVVTQAGLSNQEMISATASLNTAKLAMIKNELSGEETAAQKALKDKLAKLSEEQAANHDNYAKVLAIENEKIAALTAAGAKYTAELSAELGKRETMEREHAAKLITAAEQDLSAKRKVDSQDIAQFKDDMAEEVAAGNMTKAQEARAVMGFQDQKHAAELSGLQSLLDTLGQESDAYKKLYREIGTLKAQWATEDKRLNREMVQDMVAQWDSATAPISNAIEGQVGPLLRGTETMGQAVTKMAGNIVVSYAEMAVKAGLKWLGMQAMQILWTGTSETAKTAAVAAGTTARTGLETAATASTNTGILARIWAYIFGESAKTAATTSGTAARIAEGQTETAAGNTGLLVKLGRWIATELGLTAATTAQTGVRSGEQIAADATSATTAIATNVTQAMSSAAVGATAAGASVAAIPMVGWTMVPGVMASTYGMLAGQAAFASLATGTMDVPQDMHANLHAGEMVVPETFADGIRSSMRGGGAGGGGGDMNLHYAPKVTGQGSDLAGMMRSQANSMKSYLWHATRNGALQMPGR